MTGGEQHSVSGRLEQEMQAALASLRDARARIRREDFTPGSELWPDVGELSRRIDRLSPADRGRLQPLLLALLDEVEQAIATLKEEMADARRELNAAHRGRIAGTAYRQGGRL